MRTPCLFAGYGGQWGGQALQSSTRVDDVIARGTATPTESSVPPGRRVLLQNM